TSTVSRGGRRCAGSAGTTASKPTAVQRNWRTALIMGTFRELECEMECIYGDARSTTSAVDNTMTSFHYAPEGPFVHRVFPPSRRSRECGEHLPGTRSALTLFGVVQHPVEPEPVREHREVRSPERVVRSHRVLSAGIHRRIQPVNLLVAVAFQSRPYVVALVVVHVRHVVRRHQYHRPVRQPRMYHSTPYLIFNGNCREAMTFYQTCLGGELSVTTFGESGQ